MTIKNTSASFGLADVSNHTVTLTLDGNNNVANTTITKLKNSNNLSINFNGQGAGKEATLTIQDSSASNQTIPLQAFQ